MTRLFAFFDMLRGKFLRLVGIETYGSQIFQAAPADGSITISVRKQAI
jgi:hypothetical protein